ncbi:hypothetical protein CEXT_275111 [Caerostris extrusa]|uniref:Uncharacterized protein n=1 Tax=Caerostris extrusa TaxID=172846 RepID=A0AAV4SUI1_CAEEX|nr:hypothetical protein CEXT_275111 [Caerostris extrusa]
MTENTLTEDYIALFVMKSSQNCCQAAFTCLRDREMSARQPVQEPTAQIEICQQSTPLCCNVFSHFLTLRSSTDHLSSFVTAVMRFMFHTTACSYSALLRCSPLEDVVVDGQLRLLRARTSAKPVVIQPEITTNNKNNLQFRLYMNLGC